MLQSQVIGCGAAGGKAAVELVKKNIIPDTRVMLVNSTDQDKPDCTCKFVNIAEDNELGGCAKESSKGIELCLKAFESGKLNIAEWIKPTTRKVYVIASLEGGTGCGSSVVIANHIREDLGLKVHLIGISGFEEDARGLKNTVSFFKYVSPNTTVSIVSNKKFLKETNGNYPKAEEKCNNEVATIVSLTMGNSITPSEKNIDDNDLYKLTTEDGYMNICHRNLTERNRNIDDFNAILKDMIDNSKSMDSHAPKQTYMGVIINMPREQWENIDYSYSVLKEYYNTEDSVPYEVFTHLEDITRPDENNRFVEPFIAFINTGMELPTEEITAIYDRYSAQQEAAKRAKAERKNFFSSMETMVFDEDDFDLNNKNNASTKKDLFARFASVEQNNAPAPKRSMDEDY